MKGKGQYVYAHVFASKDASSGDSGAEPLFKFNNGHFGGSNACVSQEHASLANGVRRFLYGGNQAKIVGVAGQCVKALTA